MAGGLDGKPYCKALWRAPHLQEELTELPSVVTKCIEPFLSSTTTQDELHDMILVYYSLCRKYAGQRLQKKISSEIEVMIATSRRSRWLNSSPRNISLNQTIGDSKTPVSEWLNLTLDD